MEHQLEILVIGTHNKILETVLRLLNKQENWSATGVSSVAEALEVCPQKPYQVFLIGAGLTNEQEQELKVKMKLIHPEIHVISHYGGGSGLLYAEIHLALGGTENKAR